MSALSLPARLFQRPSRVNVLRLSGVIAATGRGRLSDQALAPLIERAFRKGRPRAVALVINSPGGSPVQSALIAARIRRLADETKLPVHGFVEDVAASGGYWLACAADDIHADPCSIVGSIGVISAGFGAHELLARQGVERRVYTAGKSKSQLDPFRPESPEDIARLQVLLDGMHDQFIAHVRARRRERLRRDDLFNGEYWLGAQAVELGLIDGIGHLVPHLQGLYGDKVRLNTLEMRRPWLSRFGASLLGQGLDTLEDRAAWARVGL
jgi:signal peptide peptidase SppA